MAGLRIGDLFVPVQIVSGVGNLPTCLALGFRCCAPDIDGAFMNGKLQDKELLHALLRGRYEHRAKPEVKVYCRPDICGLGTVLPV
ncbi:hypothetical protein CBR_g24082 [Chara braunii]|uniref:Uncharacterized protein n=1 Tax=Chara braunii TaxID=69332 RepID=A0A388L5Q7_CHABU|nr:hypothetical protein CBR_g24082 [Chara braunii]|eukprot:GBG77636.1 hypothetical protein CBR_g24082 [Chara braunii]